MNKIYKSKEGAVGFIWHKHCSGRVYSAKNQLPMRVNSTFCSPCLGNTATKGGQ